MTVPVTVPVDDPMQKGCRCRGWSVTSCRKGGECSCLEECCNIGSRFNDGDGYVDFVAERSACGCDSVKEPG